MVNPRSRINTSSRIALILSTFSTLSAMYLGVLARHIAAADLKKPAKLILSHSLKPGPP